MRSVLQFALVLLWTPTIYGQVVEVQGGASDFLGNGGGMILYGSNSETRVSAGIVNGKLGYGVSQEFEFRKWDIVAGDKQFAVTSGQMYLSTPVRGLSAFRIRPFECKDTVKTTGSILGYTGKHCYGDQLYVFAGAVGSVFSSPFFFGVHQTHIGAGFGYKRELTRNFSVGTIQALAGSKRTSLEEADYRLKHFEVRAQAGWLENNLQFGGTASISANHFGATAGRSIYVFNTLSNITPISSRVTVNSAGVYGGYGFINGSASIFQSNLSTGKSLNVGAHFGWFSAQVSDYISGKQSSKLLTTTEHSLHWTLTQYVSRSNGTNSFNFGGGYQSNRFSAQLGYNFLYFPALRQPFQRVLSIQIGLRVRAASISASNIVLPNGKTEWMISADDYLQTRLRGLNIPGGTSRGPAVQQFGHGGKFVIEGWVTDKSGTPIEGAAVLIGKDEVFTDSQGHFSIRQRRKQNPVHVDFDNFMLPGEFRLVSISDTPIKIILERK